MSGWMPSEDRQPQQGPAHEMWSLDICSDEQEVTAGAAANWRGRSSPLASVANERLL